MYYYFNMKKQKNKHKNHLHVTIHQRLERLAHHQAVLGAVVVFLTVGVIKYQTQLSQVIHHVVLPDSSYAVPHKYHHETLRMPVEYGASIRHVATSGE